MHQCLVYTRLYIFPHSIYSCPYLYYISRHSNSIYISHNTSYNAMGEWIPLSIIVSSDWLGGTMVWQFCLSLIYEFRTWWRYLLQIAAVRYARYMDKSKFWWVFPRSSYIHFPTILQWILNSLEENRKKMLKKKEIFLKQFYFEHFRCHSNGDSDRILLELDI